MQLKKACKRKFNMRCLKRVQQQQCPWQERPCIMKVKRAFNRLKRQSKKAGRRGRPNRRNRRRGRRNRRGGIRGRRNRRRGRRGGRNRRRGFRGRRGRRSNKAKCARGRRGNFCRQVKKLCPKGSSRCMPKLTKKLCKRPRTKRRCQRKIRQNLRKL